MLSLYDTQIVFRHLLDCMARPGKVNPVPGAVLQKIGSRRDHPLLVAVALTLLDGEVTFAVLGEEMQQMLSFLAVYTGGRPVPPAAADFVFVPGTRPWSEILELRRGNLLFPDLGATAIFAVEDLFPEAAKELDLTLSLRGPGVPGRRMLGIRGLARENVGFLQEANHEFPLGLDVILVSAGGRLACLPRSVQLEIEQ